MILFNIFTKGFLDMEDTGGPSFKTENQQFRFADISLGRSVEFTVPATDHNRQLLGFGDDPAEDGEDLRRVLAAQMIYDGGVKNGTFCVTGYSGEAFSCVFYIENAEWINELQDKKLKDCVCTFNSVTWPALGGTQVDADQADPTQGVQIIKYDTPLPVWRLPSVNVNAYIDDILTNLGIQHDLTQLSTDYWMTAASIKGGGSDTVTFTQTTPAVASVTETNPGTFFRVVDIDLQWSRNSIFGWTIDGGMWPSKAFKAVQDCAVTFPATFPNGVYLIKWDKKPNRCQSLGGVDLAGTHGTLLKGKTIDLSKGDIIFFADKPLYQTSNDNYYGWMNYKLGYSVTIDVVQDYDMSGTSQWRIQVNAPDMTVFEFLQSVAIATGLELFVDATDGITLKAGSYGQAGDFKALENVISVDEVNRNVEVWGEGTRKAVVRFDSEDYVLGRLEAVYDVDNGQSDEEKEVETKFSEGSIGDHGVLIEDGEYNDGYQLKATKWTLTRVDLTAAYPDYLQRVDVPTFDGYDDIAMQATCLKVKVAAAEADFFELTASTTFLWRGVAYVWTDADWGDGVMGLTLQKVSQPAYIDRPYDAEVEYLESDGTQFIDTGIVPDGFTGMKVECEYVFNGMDVCGLLENSKGVLLAVSNFGAAAYWGNYLGITAFSDGVLSLNYMNAHTYIVSPEGGTETSNALGTLSFNPTTHIILFGSNHDGTPSPKPTRISAFQVTQANFIILDLIAVRVGSVGYMYDRVSGQLYDNDGTGDFIVGPDV